MQTVNTDVNYIKVENLGTGLIIKPDPAKSTMKLGSITYNCPISFNWLQRMLWKICFGVEVDNTKEEK